MKREIFTLRRTREVPQGILECFEVNGDVEGYVAEEAAQELEKRGYEIYDIDVVPEPEKPRGLSRFRRR